MLNERWKKRFSRWFKLRFAIFYPLGIWVVFSAISTDRSIMRSIWFILLGLLIRGWSNGYAIKMEKLTTSGPYAYVRNPLYLGSFLIMIGFLVMLNIPLILILFCIIIVICFVYGKVVKNEERMLLDKFGQDYLDYQKHVHAFIPTPFRYKGGGEKWGWSLTRYFKSQEYKLFLWMIILVIAFHLKDEFIIEGESVDGKIIFLLTMAFLLGLTDAIGELFRKRTVG